MSPVIGFARKAAASAYTEQLVTNPGTRYIDLSNGAELPADTRSFLGFWSGVHSSTVRKFLASWDDGQTNFRIHTGTNPGIYAKARNDESVSGTYDSAGLSGVRYHVLIQAWSTTVTTLGSGTMNLEVYLAEGSGAWTQVISAGPTAGDDAEVLQDITSAAGRLFGRLTTPATEIPTCDTARFAWWVNNTVDPIIDLSIGANRDEFVSGGITVDPATSQATLSAITGTTLLFDLYGDASNYENTGTAGGGVLTLTPGGTGSFSNA